MLPTQTLLVEYMWCPEKAMNAADMQADSEPPEIEAMKVAYEVLGDRLPFSFMSELQVSLALNNSMLLNILRPKLLLSLIL